MLKGAYNTASAVGLLPAFGWTLLIVAVLAAAGGGWLGMRWQKGTDAIADVATLQAQRAADRKAIDDLRRNAEALQAATVDHDLAYAAAADRMAGIATTLEATLNEHRQFTADQREALAELLARRPDLRELRLGDDVLRHWNRSNAGTGLRQPAAAPAAGPPGQPADPVPAAPAGDRRQRTGAAGQPRPGRRHRKRLPRAQRLAAAGGGRMADHRVALVLPGGGATRPAGRRLPA